MESQFNEEVAMDAETIERVKELKKSVDEGAAEAAQHLINAFDRGRNETVDQILDIAASLIKDGQASFAYNIMISMVFESFNISFVASDSLAELHGELLRRAQPTDQ